jgi:60 kDa SS-A/Ro ribonucleoprotein
MLGRPIDRMIFPEGVYRQGGFAEELAVRLADPEEVRKAKVFPYQLMVAWKMVDAAVPHVVRDALQDAMQVAKASGLMCRAPK